MNMHNACLQPAGLQPADLQAASPGKGTRQWQPQRDRVQGFPGSRGSATAEYPSEARLAAALPAAALLAAGMQACVCRCMYMYFLNIFLFFKLI